MGFVRVTCCRSESFAKDRFDLAGSAARWVGVNVMSVDDFTWEREGFHMVMPDGGVEEDGLAGDVNVVRDICCSPTIGSLLGVGLRVSSGSSSSCSRHSQALQGGKSIHGGQRSNGLCPCLPTPDFASPARRLHVAAARHVCFVTRPKWGKGAYGAAK
eukprot:scaffold36364_cov90-Phaeocystis_antarctica.AAC.1